MVANRAYFGRFFANDDVTAVGALPNHVVVAGENKATLNVGQQFFVALLVVFFNLTDHCKQRGDMVETLFLGGFGESGNMELDLSQVLLSSARAAKVSSTAIGLYIDELQNLNEDAMRGVVVALHRSA